MNIDSAMNWSFRLGYGYKKMNCPCPPDELNMAIGIELCSSISYKPPPRRKIAAATAMSTTVNVLGLYVVIRQ